MTEQPEWQSVLDYWIGDADQSPEKANGQSSIWFSGGDKVDREITEQFGSVVEQAVAGELDHWSGSAPGSLALIILLDQFTRNIYRGRAEAFKSDAKALLLSLELQRTGRLEKLGYVSRVFALMPMQHAEDRQVQTDSVAAFERLAQQAPGEWRGKLEANAEYARLHRDIVHRFGRFPYRNRVLQRQNTADEQAWLDDDAPTFGQG